MSLYSELQKIKSEQDVKMAYITALKLKSFNQTLVDIQTNEVWFEAKKAPTSIYAMFTQLLHYVVQARKRNETVPPLLCVIDNVKAAVMRTVDAMPLLERSTINWGKSASSFSQEALIEVSNFIGVHFVSFVIETHETEFLATMKDAIQTGKISRLQIVPDNLRQVFDKWVELVGRELKDINESDYALLFFADIMNDGVKSVCSLPAEVYSNGNDPVFFFKDKRHFLRSQDGYRRFWAIYDRPPKEEYRKYLLERRDSLIPQIERKITGAYYTPLNIVSEAYKRLDESLGSNWQKNYIVWDMCCGVGNLESKHNYPRNIFMSTLDQSDVDVMKSSKSCVGAERFQYDYLNDDIADDGSIDYTLTNKIPKTLQDAINDSKNGVGNKKLLILINPPYAEAGNGIAVEESKKGVSSTKWASVGMNDYGKAKNELFVQFLTRIQAELPNATLAVFSTPKYINAESFKLFQNAWTGEYLNGFVVHSKSFDGLKGDFPISFVVWKLGKGNTLQSSTAIELDALDRKGKPCGLKTFYPLGDSILLNKWIDRIPSENLPCIPLKNAITPATTNVSVSKWHKDAIAYMLCDSNQVSAGHQRTAIFSSAFGGGHGFYVTPENLINASVTFSVRMSTPHSWMTHQDQFYAPSKSPSIELENDCLIYMLFSGKNLSASAVLEWNEKEWQLVNHFIPYREEQVGANERFKSSFMSDFIESRGDFSEEAKAVLSEGLLIWQNFFSTTDDIDTREKLHLSHPDVGWYQIRKALAIREEKGYINPIDLTSFENAYKKLEQKIQPQFLELGFIR